MTDESHASEAPNTTPPAWWGYIEDTNLMAHPVEPGTRHTGEGAPVETWNERQFLAARLGLVAAIFGVALTGGVVAGGWGVWNIVWAAIDLLVLIACTTLFFVSKR
jgi:hypothetical protein